MISVSTTRQLISNAADLDGSSNSEMDTYVSSDQSAKEGLLQSSTQTPTRILSRSPNPLNRLAEMIGPLSCTLMISTDVLLRVLRLSILMAAGHLVYLEIVRLLAVVMLASLCLVLAFQCFSLRGSHSWSNVDSMDARRTAQIRDLRQPKWTRRPGEVFVRHLITPFLLLLSPWCMFVTSTTRTYFSAALFGTFGLVDTIGLTAFFAAPMGGYDSLGACPLDVFGVCPANALASSCFPVGFAMMFFSVWSASVVLWCWAGWMMFVGPLCQSGRHDWQVSSPLTPTR
jgi:hypothetical protein